MSDTHFEVKFSRSMIYKFVGMLIMVIVAVCFYVYEGDRAAIKTNQEAIQTSTKQIQANYTQIEVGKEKMKGHEKNNSAHVN